MHLVLQVDQRTEKTRKMYTQLLILSIVGLTGYVSSEVVHRTISVDADIWEVIKYLGVAFLGILAWQTKRFIDAVGKLNATVNEILTNQKVTQKEIETIKEKLKSHEEQIRELHEN